MKLQRSILILIPFIHLSACNNARDEQTEYAVESWRFNASKYQEHFTFSNLDTFRIDTIDWALRQKVYYRLNQREFFAVHQDSSMTYKGDLKNSISLDFLYSLEDRIPGLEEVTVLWQHDSDYCDGINYMIYDSEGKLIDKFLLAGSCEQVGYFDKKYGHFVNDSIYKLAIEENFETDEQIKRTVHTTFMRTFTITKSGRVKMKEEMISKDTLESQ